MVAVAWVAAAAAYTFTRPYLRGHATANADVGHAVRVSMSGWQPAVLHAKAGGERIAVRLVNLDDRFHIDDGG